MAKDNIVAEIDSSNRMSVFQNPPPFNLFGLVQAKIFVFERNPKRISLRNDLIFPEERILGIVIKEQAFNDFGNKYDLCIKAPGYFYSMFTDVDYDCGFHIAQLIRIHMDIPYIKQERSLLSEVFNALDD